MRFAGMAHFIIAFLFMLGSRRMAAPGRWWRLLLLAGLGVALCALFHAARQWPLAQSLSVVLFYGYFLVHELIDESYFFTVHERLLQDRQEAGSRRAGGAFTLAAFT